MDVVLRNAVMATDKKFEELKEQVEQALRRGEEREKELQMELLRREKRESFIICFSVLNFFMFLYIIFLLRNKN